MTLVNIVHKQISNYMIKLSGEIDDKFDPSVTELVGALISGKESDKIYLDLSEVTFVNSIFINVLISTCKNNDIKYSKLHILNASTNIKDVLYGANLNRVFMIDKY